MLRNDARVWARAGVALGAATTLLVGAGRTASAFCRTTTSKVPADYDPSINGCWTPGLPLYWSNACVSYDVQQDASKQISYDDAASGIATAFSKWTGTTCSTAGSVPGRVSIDVRDFGPVACDQVQYNDNGPNQHVIVFRDQNWPYEDSSNTLALTTVTYDLDTGEIYDADMEINTADQTLSLTSTVPPDGYDFESIVTHETGHFLGMAHATDTRATMYAHYTQGEDVMRLLTADDVSGICTIYPPSGMRAVAAAVITSGELAETACDPTPRHGFSTQCASTGGGCAVAPSRLPTSNPLGWLTVGLAAASLTTVGGFARRARRRA